MPPTLAPRPPAPTRDLAASGAGRPAPAAGLVQALAKAARAFTLYHPSNALIRQFLAEYCAAAEAATAGGPVAIAVAPCQLLHDGDVVYREDDREKSLAFRLHHDGVRRLTFLPHPPFEELLRLLEILAIRFTGIRQAEDDIVTLLRKAEFTSLQVLAVEDYDSDEREASEAFGRGRLLAARLPDGFDTPAPGLPAAAPIAFREVPPEAIARLRREEDPATIAPSALAVARELLVLGSAGALPAADASRFCADLRDFLVADRQLAPLAALADLVRTEAGERIRDELLRSLGHPAVLELVLAAVPAGARELPAHVARLLPFVPSAGVLDRLALEGEARLAPLVAIVAARLPAEVDGVLARLASVPAPVARMLGKAIGARAPARVPDAAVALLEHPDELLRAEALRAVAVLPAQVPPDRLVRLLSDGSERVRCGAAGALERHGNGAAARALAEALQGRALSREEGAAFARALGRLRPAVAHDLFAGWLEARRGLFRALRASERDEARRWAAVAGLGGVGGPEAERLIEAVAATADAELRRHCQATLERARKEVPRG